MLASPASLYSYIPDVGIPDIIPLVSIILMLAPPALLYYILPSFTLIITIIHYRAHYHIMMCCGAYQMCVLLIRLFYGTNVSCRYRC